MSNGKMPVNNIGESLANVLRKLKIVTNNVGPLFKCYKEESIPVLSMDQAEALFCSINLLRRSLIMLTFSADVNNFCG